MKIIIFDTESTGIPKKPDKLDGNFYTPKGEVIQLSAAVCNEELQIERFISFYCKPTEAISDGAYAIHHISNESITSLSNDRFLEDYILNDYKDIFLSTGNVFVGHNVTFDTNIVKNNLASYSIDCVDFGNPISCLDNLREDRNYHLCTMKSYKNINGDVRNKKLSVCLDELGFHDLLPKLARNILSKFSMNSSGDFHNADYDVIATWVLLNKLRASL